MKKSLQEMLEDEEFMDSVFSSVAKELIAKDLKMEEFFESEEFDLQVKLVLDYNGVIDEETLRYGLGKFKGLTAEEFSFLHETVFFKAEYIVDKSDMFEEHITQYRGLEFRLLIGQGTCYQAYPSPKESVNESNNRN